MTQQTTDKRGDVMHRISSMDCDHQPKGTQPEHNTTEERTLALGLATPPTKSRYLTRRMGWYFTERYSPCGINEIGA